MSVAGYDFSVVWYNLCECRSTELKPEPSQRVLRLVEQIKQFRQGLSDFGGVGELEYDRKGVPTEKHVSLGTNLDTFTSLLSQEPSEKAFAAGNCGMGGRAVKMENGDYCDLRNPPEEIKNLYGDPIYCRATLPSQYGVGFWSRHKIVDLSVISNVLWKEFHPGVDLSPYRDGRGNPLPDSMRLFDKAMIKAVVEVNGHRVHVIVLHAVPAFAFGSANSPNVAWNGEQMVFLSWVLTGRLPNGYNARVTDDADRPVKPVELSERGVAMGDFNADYTAEGPGSAVLKGLVQDPRLTTFPKGPTDGKQQLDYMISWGLDLVESRLGESDPEKLSDHVPVFCGYNFSASASSSLIGGNCSSM